MFIKGFWIRLVFCRRKMFSSAPVFLAFQNNLFKDNHSDAYDQKRIKVEETPGQQSHADSTIQKDVGEINHGSAFLCSAGSRKGCVACTDIQQAAQSKYLVPRDSTLSESVVNKNYCRGHPCEANKAANKLNGDLSRAFQKITNGFIICFQHFCHFFNRIVPVFIR